MYLISAYFDEKTNITIERWIEGVARASGNHFMPEHNVPPHLTVSAFDARDPEPVLRSMNRAKTGFASGEVEIVSFGCFLPYVMYVTPVLDRYLRGLARDVYEDIIGNTEDDSIGIRINRFYDPDKWFPHITIGKTLEEEQMKLAFAYMQKAFIPIKGRIVELGLAKTNPHEDLLRFSLN